MVLPSGNCFGGEQYRTLKGMFVSIVVDLNRHDVLGICTENRIMSRLEPASSDSLPLLVRSLASLLVWDRRQEIGQDLSFVDVAPLSEDSQNIGVCRRVKADDGFAGLDEFQNEILVRRHLHRLLSDLGG